MSWAKRREAERAATDLRRRIEAARAEAAYLRAAVEELTAIGAQPGEEDELADRRQALMRAEKVAGDISDAQEIVSGGGSPVPTLANLVRRLERKAGEAGPLFAETIAALDRALVALDEAATALDAAARTAEYRSSSSASMASSHPAGRADRNQPRISSRNAACSGVSSICHRMVVPPLSSCRRVVVTALRDAPTLDRRGHVPRRSPGPQAIRRRTWGYWKRRE